MLSNYHYSDLNRMTDSDGDVMKFQIAPKYGSGQEILVRVIDGMYVSYTENCVNQGETTNADDYCGIISMYQLFDGEAQLNFKNGTACIIKKNDIVNFAGNAEFESATAYRSNFVSIGLLCYYDELMLSLAGLNLGTAELEKYYQDVSSYKDVLIYNNDLQFSDTAKDLKAALLNKNMFFIKTKALEMLYLGITNYGKYKNVSKQKYNRSHLEQIANVKAQIDTKPQKSYTIAELAEYCKISPTYFKRMFKESIGMQPHQYIVKRRLEKSREMLVRSEMSILDISEELGFASSSRFAETFKKEYGYLPSAYRREMKKEITE